MKSPVQKSKGERLGWDDLKTTPKVSLAKLLETSKVHTRVFKNNNNPILVP